MTMLVLTADELRVAAKMSGASAPGAVGGGWAEEDLAVADVVALRGLLARGLASARDADSGLDVALTAAAHSALGPLLRPDQVIEVVRDAAAGTRRWLVGQTGDTTVVAEEREPNVWRLRPAVGPAHEVALEITAELVAGLPPSHTPAGTAMVVPADALAGAVRASRAGDSDTVGSGLLVAAPAAAVLADLDARVTVALPGAGHLTWLETGESGTWLAQSANFPDSGDVESTVLTGAGPAEITTALARLLGTWPASASNP